MVSWYNKTRVANSMVEYSAFNRIVLGSSPRQPTLKLLDNIKIFLFFLMWYFEFKRIKNGFLPNF